jgi:hypothetical protein
LADDHIVGLFIFTSRKGSADMASFHHRIKSGRKGAAAEHSAYIARIGRHEGRSDLLDIGFGNLPDWAGGEPTAFWAAADKYERANGASYREHVIALPGELTIWQIRELVEKIARELIGSRPFQYAIHSPPAALGEVSNIHVHLMFSDRMPDGITRPAELMFRRFNADAPEKGGCRKVSGGRTRMQLRDELIEVRRKCAVLQNEALASHGHAARVDHRSLKKQGVSRSPEKRLGPARIRAMSPDEKKGFREARLGG